MCAFIDSSCGCECHLRCGWGIGYELQETKGRMMKAIEEKRA
jgi:hypothetical protein